MSDQVSRKALLEWIVCEENITSGQHDHQKSSYRKQLFIGALNVLRQMKHAIKAGRFDIPASEGEATLREEVERLGKILDRIGNICTEHENAKYPPIGTVRLIQKLAAYNDDSEEPGPSISSMGLMLKEESGIQKMYKIGEPIGIVWEPHNRDFEVCDIRHIRFEQSGKCITEYQLCRIGKPEYMTDWLPEEKIFTIPGITDGGEKVEQIR